MQLTERVAHLAGRGGFDIEALGYEAAAALTTGAGPDPAENGGVIAPSGPGPVTSEAQVFQLAESYPDPALREALAEVNVWREIRSKGAGTGKFQLVPYFYTKATAKKPSVPSKTTEKLFKELDKAKSAAAVARAGCPEHQACWPHGVARAGHPLRHHGRHPRGAAGRRMPASSWPTLTAWAPSLPTP